MADNSNLQMSNTRRLWIGVIWGGLVGLGVGWVASLLGVAIDAAEDVANNRTSDMGYYLGLSVFIAMWAMLISVALGSFLGGILALFKLERLGPAGGALVAVGFFLLVLSGNSGGIDPTLKNLVFVTVLLFIGLAAGSMFRDRVESAFVQPRDRTPGSILKS